MGIVIKYVYDRSIREVIDEAFDSKNNLWVKLNKGKKIGVVVALSPTKIGYSSCVFPDRFSKGDAIKIAVERANGKREMGIIPHKIRKDFEWVTERAKRMTWNNNL